MSWKPVAAPFEDRMILAFEAAKVERERRGTWNHRMVAAACDDWAVDPGDWGDMFDTVLGAMQSAFPNGE